MPSKEHIKRIKQELTKAGMTRYGQHKMASRHLPTLIVEDEHIKGVIYGQCPHGLAMIIATDKRLVYLERRPGFTSSDDVSYDVVAGVTQTTAVMATSVTVHTRVGDYTLRFVNSKCADIFVHYIDRKLEHLNGELETLDSKRLRTFPVAKIPADARQFLAENETGVLSTSDRTGEVHGAVVYYLLGRNGYLYILTKSETTKARNIRSHSEVALTVFDAGKLKTVQIKGSAEIETDIKMRRAVFDELTKPRQYGDEVLPPPLTQLKSGSYVAFKITPTFTKFSDFKKSSQIIPSNVPKK